MLNNCLHILSEYVYQTQYLGQKSTIVDFEIRHLTFIFSMILHIESKWIKRLNIDLFSYLVVMYIHDFK